MCGVVSLVVVNTQSSTIDIINYKNNLIMVNNNLTQAKQLASTKNKFTNNLFRNFYLLQIQGKINFFTHIFYQEAEVLVKQKDNQYNFNESMAETIQKILYDNFVKINRKINFTDILFFSFIIMETIKKSTDPSENFNRAVNTGFSGSMILFLKNFKLNMIDEETKKFFNITVGSNKNNYFDTCDFGNFKILILCKLINDLFDSSAKGDLTDEIFVAERFCLPLQAQACMVSKDKSNQLMEHIKDSVAYVYKGTRSPEDLVDNRVLCLNMGDDLHMLINFQYSIDTSFSISDFYIKNFNSQLTNKYVNNLLNTAQKSIGNFVVTKNQNLSKEEKTPIANNLATMLFIAKANQLLKYAKHITNKLNFFSLMVLYNGRQTKDMDFFFDYYNISFTKKQWDELQKIVVNIFTKTPDNLQGIINAIGNFIIENPVKVIFGPPRDYDKWPKMELCV